MSAFVRANPNASAEEVIRRGARAGLDISRTLIATVRAKDLQLGPPPRTKRGLGAAFVRQHPDLSADQVLALAKRSRVKVTREHVYVIRSRDRLAAEGRRKSTKKKRRS